MNSSVRRFGHGALFLALAAGFLACNPTASGGDGGSGQRLSGLVKADGSSTVFPITEAVAEEFQKVHRGVRVTVGISGTGGGFNKLCSGEADITNASRSIKDSEGQECARAGIEYIEIPVAYDGISVVANPKNDFLTCITKAELKKLWEPEAQGQVTKWSQVRAGWPDETIKLYGPGTDSGTFDYFTDAVTGKEKASRGDFTPSEDDNVLVQGVVGDKGALGYFGYAYYLENKNKLKLVSVDSGDGKCIAPNEETIQNFSYYLSRPIFIYVKAASMDKPEVREFVNFYLKYASDLVPQVGYIPLMSQTYQTGMTRAEQKKTGTAYPPGVSSKTPLDQVYR